MDTEKRAVACNIAESTKVFPKGALAFVVHLPNDSQIRIVGRSHSGRWVDTWINVKLLANFRFKTVVRHPYMSRFITFYPGHFDDRRLREVASWGAGQGLDLRSGGNE